MQWRLGTCNAVGMFRVGKKRIKTRNMIGDIFPCEFLLIFPRIWVIVSIIRIVRGLKAIEKAFV